MLVVCLDYCLEKQLVFFEAPWGLVVALWVVLAIVVAVALMAYYWSAVVFLIAGCLVLEVCC